LIDSRTGFAELPDLSLGYLADQIVLVAGLNPQNLKGLELTLRALLASDERIPIDELHRQLCVVFSPIPAAEDETVFAALEEAHSLLNQSRRIAANREYKRAPESFVLHYTPILAPSEFPWCRGGPNPSTGGRSCASPTTWRVRPGARTRTRPCVGFVTRYCKSRRRPGKHRKRCPSRPPWVTDPIP